MVLLSQNVSILDDLLSARSYADQGEALRALKNETVGHVMKKEKWVELGVLRPIVRVIMPERPTNWPAGDGRADRQDIRGAAHKRQSSSAQPVADLEADGLARLQALELLGIFASGGPAFLPPLHVAGALHAILAHIDPLTIHPRLVNAALRSLTTIVKASLLVSNPAASPPPVTTASLANTVFSATYIHAFYTIIVAAPRVWWVESMSNTAISLIGMLCRETRHQTALAKAGILDALAIKVASYVVAQGQVVPGAEVAAEKDGLRDAIPDPASPRMDIAAVLGAVAAIIGDSRLHACMLLYAPPILAIFPQLEFESSVHDINAAWKALSMDGLSSSDQQPLGALDYLLPVVPSQQPRSHSGQNTAFPPLGSTPSREHLPSMGRSGNGSGTKRGSSGPQTFNWTASNDSGPKDWNPALGGLSPEGTGEESESPMIPWLINLVRSASGLERLMAASVLTSLFKAGFAHKSRESAMALLIVPVLLRMLDEAAIAATGAGSGNGSQRLGQGTWSSAGDIAKAEEQATTEAALAVLARLAANSEVLQKAAVDGQAINILAKLLKESYEPVSVRSNPRPWNPTPTSSATVTRTGTPVAAVHGSGGRVVEEEMSDASGSEHYRQSAASQLGRTGQSSLLAYRVRLREATLRALTALIAVKYDYQQQFVDKDVMPYLVASLSPTPSKPRGASKDKTKMPKEGEVDNSDLDAEFDAEYGRNPVGVLVAACNCVRMLSRSIALVRTTLEDAGVAAPVFRLMRHPDVDVQVAAMAVVCNLVTETSPMRERYAEAGVIKILCDYAHSHNAPLRLNALWALKHFVDGIEPSMKKACLEQLGSGWLVQLVDPDTESDASTGFFPRADSYRSGAGLAVASTAMDDGSIDEDVKMFQSSEGEEGRAEEDEDYGEAAARVAGNSSRSKMPWAAPAGSPSFQRAKFPRTIHERSRTGRLRQAEAKLAAVREMELNAARKSQNDDAVIQEQGLNFIRNLIGPGSDATVTAVPGVPAGPARDVINEATEMIDYLFNEIGQDRLFQILLSKLIPRVRLRFGRRRAGGSLSGLSADVGGSGSGPAAGGGGGSGSGSTAAGSAAPRVQAPRVKVIEAVVFILVHISASVPRHRQVVIAQTELLKALIGQFASRDKGVRLALCHLLTNLMYRDDVGDTQGAAARIMELRRLGLLKQLERLQDADAELDVREQAKMAMHQIGSFPM